MIHHTDKSKQSRSVQILLPTLCTTKEMDMVIKTIHTASDEVN